jgi:Fe-S-cluster-containing dehydrogenase component/DMSO reductase anchor subunit
LAEQQQLTAVERFARVHEQLREPVVKRYIDPIPLSPPGPGQQYAFEVDLDRCTGCKACVTGCHNLNGLDRGEVWRTVGLLHGGSARSATLQTVTTSCHHCLDPACMDGCPVRAYEKDPITGIVKHLDDQCIGCQYCTFTCPYDAPKYNRQRGIVRKCDMCSDRLAHGEAPACVQSCPNEAIRITLVDQAQVVEESAANVFVPGSAAPGATLPTTIYKTTKPVPRNLLPANYYQVSPEAPHLPLVIMLVLTQLSVGAFCINLALAGEAQRTLERSNALFALVLGLASFPASVFHLGRPLYAFRALLGLKTSWMSREILAFSLFAAAAVAYAASLFDPLTLKLPAWLPPALGGAVALFGLLGVACSVMIYAVTHRALWHGPSAAFRFLSTAAILGAATILLASAVSPVAPRIEEVRVVCRVLIACAAAKLIWEAALFRHLGDRHQSPLKRSAILMSRALRTATTWRFVCGALGGVVVPALQLAAGTGSRLSPAVALSLFAFALTGELLERLLFFAASSAPRMPGAIG